MIKSTFPALLLLASPVLPLRGQLAVAQYGALKEALALSDAQLAWLEENRAWAAQCRIRGDSLPPHAQLPIEILDETQRARLSVLGGVLNESHKAAGAIAMGLITRNQWPVDGLLCPIDIAAAWDFKLTSAQVRQIVEVRSVYGMIMSLILEKEQQLLRALNEGGAENSAEIRHWTEDLDELYELIVVPERDMVLSVLDERQTAMFEAFENGLELARQAIELGLLVGGGIEGLCN